MKKLISALIFIYLLALNTSIAAMEITAWTLFAVMLVRLYQTRDFRMFKENKVLNWALLAFVAAVVTSVLVNPPLRPYLYQIGFMRWVIVLWVLAFALQEIWTPAFEDYLVLFWIWIVTVTGVYATIQCLFDIDLLRTKALETPDNVIWRAVGWFSESLNFAYTYGMSVFALSRPAFKRGKYAGWAVAIIGMFGIIAPDSRGAWLAAIFCVLFYLAFERRVWVVPAAIYFYGLSKLLAWYAPGFGAKINGMKTLTMDESEHMRIDLWHAYWHMFLDHPLFGVGFLQGDKLLPEYYHKLGIVQPFMSHAHNNLLQFLGCTGFFGFITYCIVSSIFLYKAWRLRRHVASWGWSLLLAQLYLQLGGLTQCNFIEAANNHFLLFIWALILMFEFRHKQSIESHNTPPKKTFAI